MTREELLGLSKLKNPDGTWRVKKMLIDDSLHLLVGAAVGGGLLAIWHLGPVAIAAAGAAGTIREGVQWARSGSPHLIDRAKDIVAFIVGGTLSWLVSLFFS